MLLLYFCTCFSVFLYFFIMQENSRNHTGQNCHTQTDYTVLFEVNNNKNIHFLQIVAALDQSPTNEEKGVWLMVRDLPIFSIIFFQSSLLTECLTRQRHLETKYKHKYCNYTFRDNLTSSIKLPSESCMRSFTHQQFILA